MNLNRFTGGRNISLQRIMYHMIVSLSLAG
jgi:hypothetical protein